MLQIISNQYVMRSTIQTYSYIHMEIITSIHQLWCDRPINDRQQICSLICVRSAFSLRTNLQKHKNSNTEERSKIRTTRKSNCLFFMFQHRRKKNVLLHLWFLRPFPIYLNLNSSSKKNKAPPQIHSIVPYTQLQCVSGHWTQMQFELWLV